MAKKAPAMVRGGGKKSGGGRAAMNGANNAIGAENRDSNYGRSGNPSHGGRVGQGIDQAKGDPHSVFESGNHSKGMKERDTYGRGCG